MAFHPDRLDFLFNWDYSSFTLEEQEDERLRVSMENDDVARAVMEHKDTLNEFHFYMDSFDGRTLASLGTKRLVESIEYLTNLKYLTIEHQWGPQSRLVHDTVILFLRCLEKNHPRHGTIKLVFANVDIIDDEILSHIPHKKVDTLAFSDCRLPFDLSSYLSRSLADHQAFELSERCEKCTVQNVTRLYEHYQHLKLTDAGSSLLGEARDFVAGNRRLAKIEFDSRSDGVSPFQVRAPMCDILDLLAVSCASEVSVNMLYHDRLSSEVLGNYLSRDNRIDSLSIGPFAAGDSCLEPILLGLRSNNKVKRLTIRKCRPVDYDCIRDFLLQNTSLQGLDVSMASMYSITSKPPDKHALMRRNILAGLHHNRTLKNLCFHLGSSNRHWPDVTELTEIVEFLRDHPAIVSLRIVFDRIPIGFDELTELSIAREHPLELDVAYAPHGEPSILDDTIAIAKVMKAQARIGKLSFYYSEYFFVSEASTQALTRMIRSLSANMHLKSLKLEYGLMHRSVIEALTETIPSMVSLEHLELTWPKKVPFDSFWRDKFLTLLKTSKTLSECALYETRLASGDVFTRMARYYCLRNRITATMKKLPKLLWPDLLSRLLEEDTVGLSHVMLLLKTNPAFVERAGRGGTKRSNSGAMVEPTSSCETSAYVFSSLVKQV